MNYRIGYLGVILSSTMLIACGGGPGTSSDPSAAGGPTQGNPPAVGGTPPTNPPPATPTVNTGLSKYEGIWRQECVDHMRLTMTATATGTNSFSIKRNEEYFAYADCAGDPVAVGNYGVPDEAVTYTEPLNNVSILMPSGAIIRATVDPGTAVSATAQFKFEGVPYFFDSLFNQTVASIQYADVQVRAIITRAALRGQSESGALVLLEGELYSLVPIENSTSSFRVVHRFFR